MYFCMQVSIADDAAWKSEILNTPGYLQGVQAVGAASPTKTMSEEVAPPCVWGVRPRRTRLVTDAVRGVAPAPQPCGRLFPAASQLRS